MSSRTETAESTHQRVPLDGSQLLFEQWKCNLEFQYDFVKVRFPAGGAGLTGASVAHPGK
jgi:hypothetical protein